ncbi:hypothetical protein Q9233_015870 [Columba guinea]|nr:hypothetical protein Q9233_015870 [Columba guinea]
MQIWYKHPELYILPFRPLGNVLCTSSTLPNLYLPSVNVFRHVMVNLALVIVIFHLEEQQCLLALTNPHNKNVLMCFPSYNYRALQDQLGFRDQQDQKEKGSWRNQDNSSLSHCASRIPGVTLAPKSALGLLLYCHPITAVEYQEEFTDHSAKSNSSSDIPL